jgi:RNA polymerase sigma factor (sigma-70 family)
MATTQLGTLLRHIEQLASVGGVQHWTDRQLLDNFAARRDEAAFAALVSRHGPMVLRVCRRVLHHEQDAEDAFQATFLVLARNTASIRKRDTLANWLHGVAYRTAMNAKRIMVRRRNHEARFRTVALQTTVSPTWDETQAVLDEEIQRLPPCFREAFVLCVLEGKCGSEAAVELGCKEGTVRSRVKRARRLLQQQLARRGIKLSALLAALAVAESATRAALPAALARATIRFGLLVAAGGPAAGVIPSHVAALAAGATGAMFLTQAKIVTVVMLALSVVTSAAMLARQASAEKPAPPTAGPQSPRKASALMVQEKTARAVDDEANETLTVAGQVVDPEGKPVAGAKVYLLYYTPKALPVPVRDTTNRDGRFRFEVAKGSLDRSYSALPWAGATVVAVADGYGLGGLSKFAGPLGDAPTDLTLGMAKDDVPITGRCLDLQGKPLAGITVRVEGLHTPKKSNSDMTGFLQDLRDRKLFYPPLRDHLTGFEGGWMGRDLGTLFPPIVSGADGRFTIRGAGRERLVTLRLESPAIVTAEVFALTRPGTTLQVPDRWRKGEGDRPAVVHGAAFDQVLAPCKPIVGVVRDQGTGKPIAGAIVTSYQLAGERTSARTHLRAIADEQGRYRLTGLPKGEGNRIRAAPPEGQPYLMMLKSVPDTPSLEPVTVDFDLHRGIWITARVLDKVTGKPLPASVSYGVFQDNPHGQKVAGLTIDHYMTTRAEDGTCRFVGLPGRGLIGVRARGDRYATATGADKIKGFEKGGTFPTVPMILFAPGYHGLIEVDPANGTDAFGCDIALDPGRMLTGTVVDTDGQPLAGAQAAGLTDFGFWESTPLKTAEFTLTGLLPDRPRLLQFVHKDKHLAGSLVVQPDEKGPLTVKLRPAGTIVGRVVRPDGTLVTLGQVVAGEFSAERLLSGKLNLTFGSSPGGVQPDKDGRFRIEGLVPGLKYRLALSQGSYLQMIENNAVTVEAGETKDLGDVKVRKGDE